MLLMGLMDIYVYIFPHSMVNNTRRLFKGRSGDSVGREWKNATHRPRECLVLTDDQPDLRDGGPFGQDDGPRSTVRLRRTLSHFSARRRGAIRSMAAITCLRTLPIASTLRLYLTPRRLDAERFKCEKVKGKLSLPNRQPRPLDTLDRTTLSAPTSASQYTQCRTPLNQILGCSSAPAPRGVHPHPDLVSPLDSKISFTHITTTTVIVF